MTTATKPRHDGLNWHAHAVIEKYSPDQAAYAEARWAEAGSSTWERFGRTPTRPGGWSLLSAAAAAPRIHGAYLKQLCGAPEDGVREEAGNLLVTAGLDQITKLLIGSAATAIANANSICGVGAGTTAAAVGDVKLTDDGTSNAFYQIMDSGYPTQSNGVMTGQCTFASGNANFAWNEWCWATASAGTGANTGTTLASLVASSTQTMWNHKVPASSLGTKASGASWVFTTTITLS